MPPSSSAIPILMYHALWLAGLAPQAQETLWAADPQLKDPGARLYALDTAQFERHMSAIAQNGWHSITNLDQLRTGIRDDKKILITFDDGHQSNAQLALPLLQKYGHRALFFITTDWIDTPGFMTRQQLLELHQAGMMLGTHGCSHAYFSDLPAQALGDELTRSKQTLQQILGKEVTSVALPGGRNHPQIQALARQAGYQHIFTSRIGLADPVSGDPLDWPRVPITGRQNEDFLPSLLRGQSGPLEAMSRSARRRDTLKRLLGNRGYDLLRALAIRLRG